MQKRTRCGALRAGTSDPSSSSEEGAFEVGTGFTWQEAVIKLSECRREPHARAACRADGGKKTAKKKKKL